ncbi:MAG: hypothetical protein IH898_08205 [Planctomycetes bacterium]|nr:hypothetical protein [Planctomycetota bacterium]
MTAVVGGKKIYRPRSRVDYRGPICVKGVDTSELVDGEHFSAQGVFEVLGNYTYDTAGGGTNTVKQIGLIDLSEYEDLFTLKHTAREWSDKSGEHTIKALFIEHKSGIVHLKTTDGEEKKIKLSALSKDDQKYVREKVTGKRR